MSRGRSFWGGLQGEGREAGDRLGATVREVAERARGLRWDGQGIRGQVARRSGPRTRGGGRRVAKEDEGEVEGTVGGEGQKRRGPRGIREGVGEEEVNGVWELEAGREQGGG